MEKYGLQPYKSSYERRRRRLYLYTVYNIYAHMLAQLSGRTFVPTNYYYTSLT